MLKIYFLKTQYQDAPLLGRTVKEHMLSGLCMREEDMEYLGQGEEPEDGSVVLSLDMPLVTARDVMSVAERMRAKGIASLRLGGADSPSRIVLKRGDSGYFSNSDAFLKIADAKSYSMVYNHMRSRIVDSLLDSGVRIPFYDSVAIDCTAKVEAGAEILPFSRIEGDALIRSGAVISASLVRGGEICSLAQVEMSHLENSFVGEGASVGPFARLRGAHIGAGCRVGDFVEVKASTLGDGAKAAHLAYIGDASVGARTNIGCGAVFCNFDGKQKRRIDVGNDCFIGANVNLVAPLSVGDGAFIAAGTTVTDDVGDGTFTIGRARQTTKT